jgi:hypothetical protein
VLHSIFKLLIWLAGTFFIYGAIAAPVTYILHRRSGARTMAAEALIAWILSILSLAILYLVYDYVA